MDLVSRQMQAIMAALMTCVAKHHTHQGACPNPISPMKNKEANAPVPAATRGTRS